jgi:hypothetical protein
VTVTGQLETVATEDLVEMAPRRYVFLEHSLARSGGSHVFTVGPESVRSYVVTRGRVRVRPLDGDEEATEYSRLTGWNAHDVAFDVTGASE